MMKVHETDIRKSRHPCEIYMVGFALSSTSIPGSACFYENQRVLNICGSRTPDTSWWKLRAPQEEAPQ